MDLHVLLNQKPAGLASQVLVSNLIPIPGKDDRYLKAWRSESASCLYSRYKIEITLLVQSDATKAFEETKRLEIEKEINNTLTNSSYKLKEQLHAEYVSVKTHKVATPGEINHFDLAGWLGLQ